MPYQHIDLELESGIGYVWLNRPEKRNALSADMWTDIPAAVAELTDDPGLRVIVVGARGTSFTVGIDIQLLAGFSVEGPSEAARNQELYRQVKKMQGTFSCLAESPVPVIAAIHGYCIGAGVDLITACDIRLASEDATFSIRETKMGLVADVGTMQRLPLLVAPGHVAELAYTGSDIDAARAERIGLVNHVYSDVDALHRAAGEMAAAIASNPPMVIRGIKAVLEAGRGRSVEEALDYVALWNAAFIKSNDMLEAMSAFFDKRPPDFTGT